MDGDDDDVVGCMVIVLEVTPLLFAAADAII